MKSQSRWSCEARMIGAGFETDLGSAGWAEIWRAKEGDSYVVQCETESGFGMGATFLAVGGIRNGILGKAPGDVLAENQERLCNK